MPGQVRCFWSSGNLVGVQEYQGFSGLSKTKARAKNIISFPLVNASYFFLLNVAPQRSGVLLIVSVRIQTKTDLISLHDAIDTTTPQGKFTFQLFVAQLSLKKILIGSPS